MWTMPLLSFPSGVLSMWHNGPCPRGNCQLGGNAKWVDWMGEENRHAPHPVWPSGVPAVHHEGFSPSLGHATQAVACQGHSFLLSSGNRPDNIKAPLLYRHLNGKHCVNLLTGVSLGKCLSNCFMGKVLNNIEMWQLRSNILCFGDELFYKWVDLPEINFYLQCIFSRNTGIAFLKCVCHF